MYNLEDFGVTAKDSSPTEIRIALQTAIDSIPPTFDGLSKHVFIPSSEYPWIIDKPIYIDKSYVGLSGDPLGGSRLEMAWHNHSSCIMIGMTRNPKDEKISDNNFIDLFGKLDSSAVSSANQRWGIRTCSNSHLVQGSGPLSFGWANFSEPDYWGNSQQLTVEFATDYSLTPFDEKDAIILGCSHKSNPQPYILLTQLGKYKVIYKTSDEVLRSFSFSPPSESTVHRIAFQIDLNANLIAAFIDGFQVEVYPQSNNTPGLKFTPNIGAPFKFNSAGYRANSFGTNWWTDEGSKDKTLYGLRISNISRYVFGNPGDQQKRIDGRTINDFYSFFDLDQGTVAFLPLTDKPSDVINDRLVTVKSLPGDSVAMLLSPSHASEYTGSEYNSIKNLTILSHDPAYGDAITLGYSLHLWVDNCSLSAGGHALGTWNWGSNYFNYLTNSNLGGRDAAIRLYYGMMMVDNCRISRHGRNTIWPTMSMLNIRNMFGPDGGCPEYIVRSDIGSQTYIDCLTVDFESDGGLYPSKGAIYASGSTDQGGTLGGELILNRINFGTIGKGCPFITLDNSTKNDSLNCNFELKNSRFQGSQVSGIVYNKSKLWKGDVHGKSIYVDKGVPLITSDKGCNGIIDSSEINYKKILKSKSWFPLPKK